jgi:2-polyprenyl-3-methyl-5-hydroxy-6-metoxy-1,4-benzoquinol methylase
MPSHWNHCEHSHAFNIEVVRECNLCQGQTFTQELEASGWNLIRCSSCNLVFTSPRYTEEYLKSLYEKSYYEKAESYLSGQLSGPYKDLYGLAKSARKLFREEKRLNLRSLDVGCGGGVVVWAFKSMTWESLGIDPSEKAVDSGRRLNLDLRTMGVEDPELGKFDLVTALHVLEHTYSPQRFLRDVAHRLKANGFFILEVPNYESHGSRKWRQNWPYLFPDLHLYQFTPGTITKYLEGAHFEVLKIYKVNGRGPLGNYDPGPSFGFPLRTKLKNRLFNMRKLIYWLPGSQHLLRWFYWQLLGYGEFIRVLSQKK